MTGGITIASTPDRWEWLQSAYRTYQTIGIEDVYLMTPDEIKQMSDNGYKRCFGWAMG